MISYLDENEKKRSEELWKQAFPEDSQSFDRYYFCEKMKENRVIALYEDGGIVSMAHLNPYVVRAGESSWKCDYIVGVATDRDKRHRGYMRRVLTQMMQDMYAEGMPFCFLMPADERIYLPFDFTYIFDQPQWKLSGKNALVERDWKEAGMTPEMIAGFMNRWLMKRYEVYCRRDEAYVSMLLKELESEGGWLKCLYDGTRLAGLRAEWGLEKREQRLLYCKKGYAVEDGPAKPAIMARIICLPAFLKAVRLTEDCAAEGMTVKLAVEDGFLPENQGCYLWYVDKDGSSLEKVSQDLKAWEHKKEALRISVSGLTSWLFGYRGVEGPEWTRDVRTFSGIFLDEVV